MDELIQHKDIKDKNIPILFFANKMDLKEAISAKDIVSIMELEKIVDRSWNLQ